MVSRSGRPRALTVLLSLPLWLAGCAPAALGELPAGAAFRAAFSDQGVAWVASGRACVARAPSFRVNCPPLPPAVDVAWNGPDAWAGVPGVGVVVTLDGAARTVDVGRVAALSAGRVYREDGSAVTYANGPVRGVPGRPSAAVTVGDAEFALVGGEVRRVADGAVLARGAAFLTVTPDGAAGSAQPQLVTAEGTYRLTGERLERLDPTGRVVATTPHGPGRVGRVGSLIVTVDVAGTVRAFGVDLSPVR
ncbi:hypothetical protein CBQ26_17950 [Deinococcus indicus]|uniref:Uncharacterized protein n=1 Tax=Deinococcus indicus TaxID=223556 RepID=A0A246BGD3_9DEIO|nr:hypothetical protein [Deinococcus indicus]OWL93948.1 hypothetical protein CBQ26_17950 [Deinococcus indicus]GHG15487.1 hypothetical protein GCM10017784_02610 [Deinococcus indicus]